MKEVEQTFIMSYSNKLTASDYYLLSSSQKGDDIYISLFSGWEPGDNTEFLKLVKEGKEYRSLCLVNPEKVIRDFALFNQKLSIVNSKEELMCANNIGGASLVSSSILQKHWSEILKPILTLKTERGFVDYASFAGKYLQRFARDEYRMAIFSRDGCQCRICGASPDDSVRVRLEVHHIKPWEEGGFSTPDNLITLCNICHAGILEIDRSILFKKVGTRVPLNSWEMVSLPDSYTHAQIIKYYYFQGNLVTMRLKKTKKNKGLFSVL